jgi:hypothetical protein
MALQTDLVRFWSSIQSGILQLGDALSPCDNDTPKYSSDPKYRHMVIFPADAELPIASSGGLMCKDRATDTKTRAGVVQNTSLPTKMP